MRTNTQPVVIERTHEGAPARRLSPYDELRRTVATCLLWEDSFYEGGASVAERIKELVPKCYREQVAMLAVEARTRMQLRHVPLLLVRELARKSDGCSLTRRTLAEVIQRPDELAEFLSLYWKEGRVPIARQVKRGLADAFRKFNEYQLAKYNRPAAIKLRDVLFLAEARPKDEEQRALWKRLVEGTLATPDTWEVALSAGSDKKETFERLIREGKLGYLALLRNLRNMEEVGCNRQLVRDALLSGAARSRALPFRFLAAARAVPGYELTLDKAMLEACKSLPRLDGETTLLIDVSGSMSGRLSSKSDLNRMDAAAALAVLIRSVCDDVRVYTFSDHLAEVPARSGMGLIDAIINSQPHGGTALGAAIRHTPPSSRLIVITDEQSRDQVPNPRGRGYMINVATYQHGVGYGPWIHIDGFSESVLSFMAEIERPSEARD
jgi:hypothetical protein